MAGDGRIINDTTETIYSRMDVVAALQAAVAGAGLDGAVRADLARALRLLGKQQILLVSLYAGGHTYREMAAQSGVSKDTARRHVSKAITIVMEGMNGKASPARPDVQRENHPVTRPGGAARVRVD